MPKPAVRTAHHSRNDEKSKKWLPWVIVAVVIALAAGLGGWLVYKNSTVTAIDPNKYQAVFFTNGQVYFGKLQHHSSEYMKLTDIYYLQTPQETTTEEKSTNPQQTTDQKSDVQLIKLGDEVHGPEDEMIISKNQLLFYENLKSDGKVAQTIEQSKGNN